MNTKNYMLITGAYTIDTADYIGNEDFAKNLDEAGIKPQLANDGDKVCTIGFCEKDQKWHGWSHRARYGFGIGSEVKKGDCAYVAKDKDDFLESMIEFWTEDSHLNVNGKHDQREGELGTIEEGVMINWMYTDDIPNEEMRSKISGCFHLYPEKYGKGEWVAKTLEDAKQMAIDFAESVS